MRPGDLKPSGVTIISHGPMAPKLPELEVNSSVPGMGGTPIVVHESGGDTLRRLLHPSFRPLERLFRVLPDGGWFSSSISSNAPVQFELGSFTVPNGLHLWLFDYEFSIYRQSGIDAFDTLKADDGRFSGCLGFDIQVGVNNRLADLSFQLDPAPVSGTRSSFRKVVVNTSGGTTDQFVFDAAAANSFAASASPGNSLLPVRNEVLGPRNGVFTLIAEETQVISLQCVIFRRLLNPVSWIEGKFGGYLVNSQVSRALIDRIRPR